MGKQFRPFFAGQAKMIETSDEIREKKCGQAIQELLNRFDCVMIPFIKISPAKTIGGVEIFAKPRNKEQKES